jgi:hypothetical protein
MKIEIALLAFFSFLFLFVSLALAQKLIAGSTYYFDFPKCYKLNISAFCSPYIEQNEFLFSPNCKITSFDGYRNYWSCDCYDGYRLNLTINPTSITSCLLTFTYTYGIEIPEVTKEYHYTSVGTIREIEYKNITIEKPVPYIPEEVNQTIEDLNKSLKEKEELILNQSKEIESLKLNLDKLKLANIFLQYLFSTLVLITILLFIILIGNYLYKRWKK